MSLRQLLKILALSLWISAFSAWGNARAETVDAIPYWTIPNGGTPSFSKEAAKLRYAEANCYAGRFGCSMTYESEGYNGYYGSWGWGGTFTWSELNSQGKTATYTQRGGGTIFFDCPAGFVGAVSSTSRRAWCSRTDPIETPCFLCSLAAPRIGNPIFLGGGVKQQVEVDYENASGTLRFVRTYRSDKLKWEHNYTSFAADMNESYSTLIASNSCLKERGFSTKKWTCFKYSPRGQANDVMIQRANGRMIKFGTDLLPAKDVNDRVTPLYDVGGARTGLQVKNGETDAIETYDIRGRIVSSVARNGLTTTFTYFVNEDHSLEYEYMEGLLKTVTDAFGHQLTFGYDAGGQLAMMTDPSGGVYLYSYNQDGALDSVTYPDGKIRRYVYGELDKTFDNRRAFLLTGIIDENNVRFANFAYDKYNFATLTEHAGGAEKYTATYIDGARSTYIDPLGTSHTLNNQTQVNVYRLGTINQPDLVLGGSNINTASNQYDVNGNISRHTDYDGSVTTYAFDLARNLETQRVEGYGSPAARTISTEWHPTFRLPTKIAEPKRLTTLTYDDHGNVLTRTVRATTDATGASGFSATVTGTPQLWTYTYDSFGHVLTAKGPRTDVNATATFTYDNDGNLSTQTNAANHTTSYSNYDLNGRVGRITDPNGLVTDISYKPRGWISSITVGGETTSYDYDGVGQVTLTTLPDGSTISYAYDDAHRLTRITDSLGNSINYTLDAMGNRTTEQSKDANGTLTRQVTRVIDALNRVKQITGAQQ